MSRPGYNWQVKDSDLLVGARRLAGLCERYYRFPTGFVWRTYVYQRARLRMRAARIGSAAGTRCVRILQFRKINVFAKIDTGDHFIARPIVLVTGKESSYEECHCSEFEF